MTWETFHSTFIRTCGFGALSTNGLMFYLVYFKSPKNMGAYKYLMIYLAIFEILYTILAMVILMDCYTLDSALFLVINSEKNHLSPQLLPIFNFLNWASFGMSIALIDVHFVFRYLVVTGNKIWTSSNPSYLLVWFLYPLIFGGIHATGGRHFTGPMSEINLFLKKVIFNESKFDVTTLDAMGYLVYPKDIQEKENVNWMSVYGIIESSVEIGLSALIMCIFGVKCYREIAQMASQKTKSKKYAASEKQFFLALVLQSVIPLVLMYIPCAINIFFCLMDSSFEAFGKILRTSIALYPLLDPLPNMFVIDSFRETLLNIILTFVPEKGETDTEKGETDTERGETDTHSPNHGLEYMMILDEKLAGIVVFPVAFLGVLSNWTVAFLIRKILSLKNSFGSLTASQSIGDALHSTIFAFIVCPMLFFNLQFLKIYSFVFGLVLFVAFEASLYSHLCISLNRLCSIVFPMKYDTIFKPINTKLLILCSWIMAVTPSFYYVYNDCLLYYSDDTLTFQFTNTPICGALSFYSGFVKYNLIILLIVIIDVITVSKVRSYKAKLSNSLSSSSKSMANRHQAEMSFLKQACFQAFVFTLELLGSFASPRIDPTNQWLRFLLSVLAWVFIHMLDGIITILFNKEFTKTIFQGIRIKDLSNFATRNEKASKDLTQARHNISNSNVRNTNQVQPGNSTVIIA